MKSLIAFCSKSSALYYRWVLFFSLIVFLGAGFFSSKLTLDSSLINLLPESYSSVRTLKEIQRDVGSFETLQVLVQGDEFEKLKEYVERLAIVLKQDPMVKNVDYLKNKVFLRQNALLYLKTDELSEIATRLKNRIDKKTMKHNPFFVDFADGEETDEAKKELSLADYRKKYLLTDQDRYYTNPQMSIIVINLYPSGQSVNVSFAKKFFFHIDRVIKENPPTSDKIFVEFGGNFKNKIDEYETLIDDVKSSIAIGLTAIFLLLLLFFRQVIPSLIISLVLIFSLNITFSIAYLLFHQLNIMTAFLFVILFGLGIDYGIHYMARFLEEYRQRDLLESVLRTSIHTGVAIKTTALTSSIAFAFFALADFKGFREFGIISCLGVLLACISYFFLAPATIVLMVKLKLLRKKSRLSISQIRLVRISQFFQHRRYWIFGLTTAITIVGIIFSTKLEFLYDFTDLRANLPQSIKVKKKLGEIFTRSNSPAIVLTEDRRDLDLLDNYYEQKIETTPEYTVDKFLSAYNILPKNQDEKLILINQIKEQIERVRKHSLSAQERDDVNELMSLTSVGKLTAESLPNEVQRIFVSKGGRLDRYGYIFPNLQLRDARNTMRFSKDVHKVEIEGKTFWASNASIVFADLLKVVVREGKYISALAFLGVCFFVFLDVLSFRRLLLIVMPLVSAGFWIGLIMFLFNIKLNFFNIVAIPTLIGVGVDNSIHIFHRLVEECRDRVLNLSNVFRTAGTAVIMSSVTTMIGFFGLSIAHHGGLKEIGVLALIGIFMTLVTSLVMLPVTYLILNRKNINELR